MRFLLLIQWLMLSAFAPISGCGSDTSPADGGVDGATPDAGPPALAERGSLALATRPDGTADLADDRGTIYLRRARAEALVQRDAEPFTISTAEDCGGSWSEIAGSLAPHPPFDAAQGRAFECSRDGVTLRWELWTAEAPGAVVARLRAQNDGTGELTVLRLTPLVTDGADGGLFLGGYADRHRILDNGADVVIDTIASLHYPDERRGIALAALPIEARGNVVSNWNVTIADLDGGRHLAAGALIVERCFPTFGIVLGSEPLLEPETNRRGFNSFVADCGLFFRGKGLAPGEGVVSEPMHIDPLSPDPWSAMEGYAEAIAAFQGYQSWTRRGLAVPNGWNSWTGSGSTGGLGTNIDETIMRENLTVMAREFGPFGVDYFQIDDGYQAADGDWVGHPERFPSGMAAFSAEIEAAGLLPGIWIQATVVDEGSGLAADHPDWLADPADSVLGGLLAPGEGKRVLDLSNPHAQGWLSDTMRRYRDDWGMRWLKLDFAYLAFPYHPRAQPGLTAVEAYRQGLLAIREGLGPDVFLLNVGLVGMGYGIVDGQRLTLDAGPSWEDVAPFDLFGVGGSYKGTVRTGARRYYFHGPVWVSHDDLLFTRTAPDAERPLTTEEHRAFASFIGLSGSIVKFGEDLRTLTPEPIDTWRRLLPTYPATARPIDLFLRHYPEQYVLPIDGTMPGHDATWTVVGLLNWGTNYDFAADGRPALMPDEARVHRVVLSDHGLDPDVDYLAQEFWTGRYLGPVRGALERTVPAHDGEVIALRPDTGRPQLLGHNRHFTQGATDLVSERWDEASTTLRVVLRVDAGGSDAVPFEYHVYVRAPPGYTLTPALDTAQEGEVVTHRFLPDTPGERELVFVFERATP